MHSKTRKLFSQESILSVIWVIMCIFYNLDQAAENGNCDVGGGKGAKEAEERDDFEGESPSTSAVWFVSAGPSGMCRSLQKHHWNNRVEMPHT